MMKEHTNYEPTFKLEVARMVVDPPGSGGVQVARDRNVGRTAVRRWVE
jgi:transposase-like protein